MCRELLAHDTDLMKGNVVMKPTLISVTEFARMMGVGRTKAYEILAEGIIKSTNIGRRRLVSRKSAQVYAATLLGLGGEE